MSVIGVPIKVLHEAEGHIVTVETTTGEVRAFYMYFIFIIFLSSKPLSHTSQHFFGLHASLLRIVGLRLSEYSLNLNNVR